MVVRPPSVNRAVSGAMCSGHRPFACPGRAGRASCTRCAVPDGRSTPIGRPRTGCLVTQPTRRAVTIHSSGGPVDAPGGERSAGRSDTPVRGVRRHARAKLSTAVSMALTCADGPFRSLVPRLSPARSRDGRHPCTVHPQFDHQAGSPRARGRPTVGRTGTRAPCSPGRARRGPSGTAPAGRSPTTVAGGSTYHSRVERAFGTVSTGGDAAYGSDGRSSRQQAPCGP